tara:strand:+ start:939 stop:1424 length:486 start_codon:yes stop_codon:yes gene_type:complete
MALLLLAGLIELAEAATAVAEGVAGGEAIAIEMGIVSEATPLLSALAAGEEAEITYGAINVTGGVAQTYANATAAYRAAAMVGAATATAAEKVWDSARKANENRKRKRHENPPTARKKLHFDSLDTNHIQRVVKPGRADGLVGFPNTYTSMLHAFRPVVTT